MEYDLDDAKSTATELYNMTPIGVLRYITALETENERLTEDVVVLNKELKCSNFFIRTYNKIKRLIKSK